MKRIIACALAVGCGGTSGEPIKGSVAIHVGSDTITPSVGAAVEDLQNDSTKALVIIGTDDISCSTDGNSVLARGTYLSFPIARTPMTQRVLVSVIRVDGSGGHLNGSTGDVVVSSVDNRVKGTVSFSTTDDMVGPISADGEFDVIRCF
jgi:hypothetical protein